ncbi:hypothetical protein HYH03_016676 [Edaphochlamys debaryana]|uniref:Uncharacterized protein n=1 Tax=Edaphochlamys debaryana TaxID=47281 RepID=A0A836BPP1_9CHLO|nr:hypothetical protein HYH03_016676 [Edaphochlamys debaryana]|eukprot:KAG2484541.1 hypothetical protein HYH03_016676 [Edaphochlamys debaryana]
MTEPVNNPDASNICFKIRINSPGPLTSPDDLGCISQATSHPIKELRLRKVSATNQLTGAWAEVNGQRRNDSQFNGAQIIIPINMTVPISDSNATPIVVCLYYPAGFLVLHQVLGLRDLYAYNVSVPRGEGNCTSLPNNATAADCVYTITNTQLEYALIPQTTLPCCPVCAQSYTWWYEVTNTSVNCLNTTGNLTCSLTGAFSTCPVVKRGLTGYNCYRGATTTCGLQIPTGTSPFNPTYKSMMDTFGQKNTASGACHNQCANTLTYNWCTRNLTRAYDYCC